MLAARVTEKMCSLIKGCMTRDSSVCPDTGWEKIQPMKTLKLCPKLDMALEFEFNI